MRPARTLLTLLSVVLGSVTVVFATGHQMKAPLDNSIVLGKPFDEAALAETIAALTKS